jgi:hypothetical protein
VSNIRRSRRPLSDVLVAVPAADAVILPGVPSTREPERDEAIYPSSAPDVRKLLLDGGVQVVWADDRQRGYLDLKAAEHWLPVVVFFQDALANGLGGVLTAAFLEYIGGARAAARSRLHLKVGRARDEHGAEVEWLEADGDAKSCLEALERFLEER